MKKRMLASQQTLKFFLAFFTITLLFSQAAFSGTGGDTYLKRIAKRYEDVQCFRAKFVQTSKAPGMIKREHASGIVYFRKDGKFRWDYDQPDIVLIISDGKTLWIYQPEDKQVMVDRAFRKKMKRFPYTFLKGMGRLEEDFHAQVLKQVGESVTLKLTPRKPIKQIKTMKLTFDTRTLLIHQVAWTSPQEVQTIISFSDIDVTSKIPDSIFQFEPPPGVDVVNVNSP